jgi:hypothetical protein
MPLAGYQPETREVQIGKGQSVEIRGLSLNHLAVLIREHFPDLDGIVEMFQGKVSFEKASVESVVLAIVSQAPGFAANLIALAAGEGDASDAEKIPGPVQLKILSAIGELTFTEVGGVGKAMEMLAALLKRTEVNEVLAKVRQTTD